jgi:HEAT repeat protein
VPELVAGLADEDPARRAEAARTLTRLGTAGAPALDALVEALADPIFLVRAMAAAAIGRQGAAAADAALGPLVRLLEDPVPPVRFWAVDSLGRMADAARAALPSIERRMEDEDQAVRGAAARALARIRAAP